MNLHLVTRKLISIRYRLSIPVYQMLGKLFFIFNGVDFGSGLKIRGLIKIDMQSGGVIKIGSNVKINSGDNFNIIGRQQKTIFAGRGVISVGNNVGMSSVAIVCWNSVVIEDGVLIGGGVVIYDTDFHSLDWAFRINSKNDALNTISKPVLIKKNSFIGAHSIILKGVTIGEKSIVGAGSVVTKDIPDGQIWAGNPAKKVGLIPQ